MAEKLGPNALYSLSRDYPTFEGGDLIDHVSLKSQLKSALNSTSSFVNDQ